MRTRASCSAWLRTMATESMIRSAAVVVNDGMEPAMPQRSMPGGAVRPIVRPPEGQQTRPDSSAQTVRPQPGALGRYHADNRPDGRRPQIKWGMLVEGVTMRKIVVAAKNDPVYTRKGEGDVIELNDGRLLLVYMEFTGDGSDIAPTRFAAIESDDGGATWDRRRVIAVTNPGEVNVYSPNLIRGADGSILLFFMRQFGHTPPLSTFYGWRSKDEGATFEPLSEFVQRSGFGLCNAVVKRLKSGRLLLPAGTIAQAGDNAYAHSYRGAMLYSDNDGRTWKEASNRVMLPMRGVMEQHVEETRDGRVVMVMRNQLGSLFLSESRDEGVTWSKPQTTGLSTPESCPEITRVPTTDDLIMVWNHSPYDPSFASHFGKRSPLTAAVSRDEGRTWGNIRDIEADPGRAFSNPGCRFTKSGQAIVNYWTCEYLPNWCMQDIIDLRVAIIDTDWFYGKG